MADVAAIAEAVGTTVGAMVAVGAVAYRPMIRRHDKRKANALFLNGEEALPGIPAVIPAGERLSNVEAGLRTVNTKLDNTNQKIDKTNVKLDAVASNVAEIVGQVRNNGGSSMKDKVDAIAERQTRDDQ